MVDKKFDADVAQFCSVTGAPVRDARDFLKQHKRLDVAIDAYYNNPHAFSARRREEAPSVNQLGALFDPYKDEDGEISIDGTIRFCSDLGVDPEDVALLALAYELKSSKVGHWSRQGWIDGWKNLGVDSTAGMKSSLSKLRNQLATDPEYFRKVYNFTFDFARTEGQRSLGIDMAQAFWGLLLPHGFNSGALTRRNLTDDVDMDGWQEKYNQWWADFLVQRKVKGISKDTWLMFLDFVRSTDSKFLNYDIEAAWPSTIDDFVDYAKTRIDTGSNAV